MAEVEEQPVPASPQSEERSEAGEEAPDGGAAAGGADAVPPPAGSPGTEEATGDMKKKIDVLLKAVGDTPIMKTKKWAVERTRTIQSLVDFIKKFLKLMASEQLFIYVNQSFAPSPDQEVGTLYEDVVMPPIMMESFVTVFWKRWQACTALLQDSGMGVNDKQ